LITATEQPVGEFYPGDCHAAEGDSELSGNAVEASLTGTFKLSVIKQADAPLPFQTLNFPLLETDTEVIIHGFAYPGDTDSLSLILERR
jgi:acetamidase/formamidase